MTSRPAAPAATAPPATAPPALAPPFLAPPAETPAVDTSPDLPPYEADELSRAVTSPPDTRPDSPGRLADSQQAGLDAVIRLARLQRADTAAGLPVPAHFTVTMPRVRPRPLSQDRPEGTAGWTGHRSARSPVLLLAAILVLQSALSLRLIWSNTAFGDEALYLWAGHLELAHWVSGTPLVPSARVLPTWFSGAPTIYPPIGAIADTYGGLAGARALSLVFMLTATILLYATATRLFSQAAGVAAAGIFAVLGPTQFLGAFATFDPMALLLLTLGAWLVVRSGARPSEPLLALAGLTLALADATKYATALWDPVVIGLAALTVGGLGWKRAAFRSVRLTGYLAVPLALALYRFGRPAYLRGVMFTTLERRAGTGATTSPWVILERSFPWIWLVIALALIAVVMSWSQPTRLLCLLLTGAMVLAPLHQAQIHTLVSLHKHVDFGAWFGAVPAGYALARAAEYGRAKGGRILAAAIGVAIFSGVIQVNALYPAGWPDMARPTAILGRLIQARHCPCLFMSSSVTRYYLLGRISWGEDGQIAGAFQFNYWDPARRRDLSGPLAYTTAIRHHYFSVIEIDPSENLALYRSAEAALTASADYRKTATIPIRHWGGEVIQIWRYQPLSHAAGGGHRAHGR